MYLASVFVVRVGALALNVGRPLVGAEALERGMTNRAVLGPFGELHLGYEQRLDPMRALI
jgi:hypothetical protein